MYYSHNAIEKKWQKFWKSQNSFATADNNMPKKYILDMFPYPSGKGLHVGHPRGYTSTDVLARMFRMQGFNVLHPIGWDAFGLPAEQYAIKTKRDPQEFTQINIDKFREQLQKLGLSYDYTREVNTSDPNYYKHTQLIFSLLYKKGLAEIQNINVNWCPHLQTVLANEELINNNGQLLSERGGHPVIKKPMQQWVLKIREYADSLLEGLDDLDWPSSIKHLQHNWIGKTKGFYWSTTIQNASGFKDPNINLFFQSIEEFRRLEFIKISLESPLASWIAKKDSQFQSFIKKYMNFNDLERTNIREPKEGLETSCYVIHPLTKSKIKIWLVNYVDANENNFYTAGISCVNKIDFLFLKKYNTQPLNADFKTLHNQFISKKPDLLADQAIIKAKILHPGVTIKLHNWIFSRQRYWGEPIPILHLPNGELKIEPESNLPIKLPDLSALDMGIKSTSMLAKAKNWVSTSYKGQIAFRETNTMPQWAGSSWYYIAYILKQADGTYLDIRSKEAKALLTKWLPVDVYVGGQEHAVLHLLYARFWHKVLYDMNILHHPEPFQQLINQGMILGPDGQKMSKSKGNIIGIDEVVKVHGADALRLNELFMGPIDSDMPWSQTTLDSCRHWLDRVYRLVHFQKIGGSENLALKKVLHRTIKDVTERINDFHFNTAISSLMVFINECYKKDTLIPKAYFLDFLKLLSCFAPHVSQEMWYQLGEHSDITHATWPVCDEQLLKEAFVNIPVQINNKVKGLLKVPIDIEAETLKSLILSHTDIGPHLHNQEIKKWIIIPNRIVNIIV